MPTALCCSGILFLALGQSVALAQGAAGLSASDMDLLHNDSAKKGWTFTLSENSATKYDLSELTGLVVPENWREDAPFDTTPPRAGAGLPAIFDWRDIDGSNYCTPIRDQAGCGSCWAFALYGSFESGIKLNYGISADLSEQWLVSCTGLGGCNGEWPANAANMLLGNPAYVDACGNNGAVLEEDMPYQGWGASCACPYEHPYFLEGYSFIGPQWGIPSRQQLKQAIVDHGPITVCVAVDGSFQAYSGGIYNAVNNNPINHAVVLVGWDDSQGDDGVWFMRNSWGSGWGESGYMRIAYETASIGYNALYVDVGDSLNGACCFNGVCVFGPEDTCNNIGGTFLGGSVTCTEDACGQLCPADVTGDGQVDTSDVLALLAAWGCSTCPDEDVDENGVVDTNDLLQIIGDFGTCN